MKSFFRPCESPGVLQAIGLECIRGENLLFSGVEFELHPRQWMQIEGANGSGKTSLLRILAGLSRPSDGEVRWLGEDIHSQRPVYFTAMAYLGHAPGIKADLSPVENLRIALSLAGTTPDLAEIEAALDRVGLGERLDVPARVLSAGQKQRVGLARLLCGNASLWILDEPFTALDVDGVDLTRQLLERHLERGGMTVLTSHQSVAIRGERVTVQLA